MWNQSEDLKTPVTQFPTGTCTPVPDLIPFTLTPSPAGDIGQSRYRDDLIADLRSLLPYVTGRAWNADAIEEAIRFIEQAP